MKPVLNLDADGVLFNFIEAVLRPLRDQFKVDVHHDDIDVWEIGDVLDRMYPDICLRQEYVKAVGVEGFCEHIPVYEGAVDGVRRLQEIADVHIVTSPWHSPHWMPERYRALEKHFGIKYNDVTFTHRKYSVGDPGELCIDDAVKHVVRWRERRRDARLWNARTNQDAQHLPRVHSWDELVELVKG